MLEKNLLIVVTLILSLLFLVLLQAYTMLQAGKESEDVDDNTDTGDGSSVDSMKVALATNDSSL